MRDDDDDDDDESDRSIGRTALSSSGLRQLQPFLLLQAPPTLAPVG